MSKRGRNPIEGVPQNQLPPEKRNSRLYSFRVNRNSGDANDARIRQIADSWMEEGIFTQMIKKSILLAENADPLTSEELSGWVLKISHNQSIQLGQMKEHIEHLTRLIHYLTTANTTPITPQQIEADTGMDFPEGFLDSVLANFDE